MFGMPCYLANSEIAEVGYRGVNVAAAATQQMRVIVGQLLLMVKSFPARLSGLPVGALWYNHGRKYTSLKSTLKSTGGDYPCVNILGHDVCLYLVSPLLHIYIRSEYCVYEGRVQGVSTRAVSQREQLLRQGRMR